MSQNKQSMPEKIGMFSLAILLSLLDKGADTVSGILEGPKIGIGTAYDRALKQKTPTEYYELLKQAKENSFRTALWRLHKKGLIEKNKKYYRLSKLGEKLLKIKIKTEHKWDGKWRLVAFDVPEKRRYERTWLRHQLLSAKYKIIQKSVFIGKFPLSQDMFQTIHERGLSKCIRLIVIGEIDDETILQED